VFARSLTAVLAAVLVLSAAGCGPPILDEQRKISLSPGEAKSADLPAVDKPQKLTVKFDAGAKVNVYIFKAADVSELTSLPADKAIKKEVGAKSGTLTADIPAKTATRVVVDGAEKSTEVSLHLTNK
jgi:hypothetical protein